VNDASPWQLQGLCVQGQQAIEQSPRPVARGWVHDQASGFVDDAQVLVFEHNGKRHHFGLEGLRLGRCAQFYHPRFAGFDFGGRFVCGQAFVHNRALLDQLLQVTSGKFWHRPSQHPV
jgi:hypothetical protein